MTLNTIEVEVMIIIFQLWLIAGFLMRIRKA